MSILIESKEENLDLNDGVESTAEAPEEQEASSIPEKFRGKSAEEIASAYTNLESEIGRLRNELGDYRTITDRFLSLEEKRVADLGTADQGGFEIDATELLSNPEKVLNDYFEHRRASDASYNELQNRLNRLEGQMTQTTLEQKHSDAVEVTSSAEFQTWVRSNPYRAGIAQQAVERQDLQALDYLLTEYKERAGVAAPEAQKGNSETAAAKRVATESSTSGNATQSQGKRFSRRKLVQLKLRNPEEYAAMGDEILRAYAEGRVDD